MRKYIFMDIDGTLHDDIYGIPESAITAIQTARKNGHKIFLSTGRGKYEVGKEFHEIGFDGAIYYAGGLVELESKKIKAVTFTQQEIEFFLNFFNQENIGFNLEGLNGSYMNNFGEECIIHFYLDPNWNHEQCISFLRNQNMVLVDQMKDQINNISKITLFSKNRDLILRWKEELKDRYKITIFDVKNSDLLYCELTYRTISKASAVDIMLKELNADLKDTIAFGDSMNDYEILQHCQLGIAMGNAVQQLKDVADDITDSVTNNGIYNSFIKYHLIEPK